MLKYTTKRMSASKPAYKKRRITPTAGYGTISVGAMASPVNKKVATLERKVARLAKQAGFVEYKDFDTALSFLLDASGEIPATGQLSLIPQTVGEAGRIGQKVNLRAIHIRGSLSYAPGASASGSPSTAHIYLMLDHQANGAAAVFGDMFTSTTLSQAFRTRGAMQRFKVLAHYVHTFNPTAGATTAYASQAAVLDIYRSMNIPIKYTGSDAAITGLESNNVFLVAGTDGGSDDIITVSGTVRLTYTDL